jgi:hypothetical protein
LHGTVVLELCHRPDSILPTCTTITVHREECKQRHVGEKALHTTQTKFEYSDTDWFQVFIY